MSNTTDKALNLLKYLPRVCLANIRDNPGSRKVKDRCRINFVYYTSFFSLVKEVELNMGVTNMVAAIKVQAKDKIS